MTPQEFNFSLLMDRLRFTLESLEMYRPSFQNFNPSMPVVTRVTELFNQIHDNLEACQAYVIENNPSDDEISKYETLHDKVENTLLDFQVMVREVLVSKVENIGGKPCH